jgi:hypothetical protein
MKWFLVQPKCVIPGNWVQVEQRNLTVYRPKIVLDGAFLGRRLDIFIFRDIIKTGY